MLDTSAEFIVLAVSLFSSMLELVHCAQYCAQYCLTAVSYSKWLSPFVVCLYHKPYVFRAKHKKPPLLYFQGPGHCNRTGTGWWTLAGMCQSSWSALQRWICSLQTIAGKRSGKAERYHCSWIWLLTRIFSNPVLNSYSVFSKSGLLYRK